MCRDVQVAELSGGTHPSWLSIKRKTETQNGVATVTLEPLGAIDEAGRSLLSSGVLLDPGQTTGQLGNYSELLARLFNTALSRAGKAQRVAAANIDDGSNPPNALQFLFDIFRARPPVSVQALRGSQLTDHEALAEYSFAVMLAMTLNDHGHVVGTTAGDASKIALDKPLLQAEPSDGVETINIILKQGAILEFPIHYSISANVASSEAAVVLRAV
jgi:hypothetical protein